MLKFKALIPMVLAAGAVLSSPSYAETLTFRFNDAEEKELRAALDRFEEANPDIDVTLQRTSWKDARDQFLRESAVGQGPDVVHIAFVWTKELAQAGAIRELDSFIAESPLPGGLENFVANDLVKQDGKIYGVPWTADTWAMVYRTDLLEQAGITKLPETWEELKAASAAVKEKTGKTGFGMPAGSASSGAMWFLANYYWWSNGKNLVEMNGEKPQLGLTEQDIADAMTYFHSFFTEGHTPTSLLAASDAHDPAIMQALANGDQAIAIMPPNTFKGVLAAWKAANPGKPVPFMSSVTPKGSATRLTHLGGRTLAMNANAKDPEAAWKLIQHLISEPIFTEFYVTQFPAQKTLLNQIKFDPAEEGFAKQLAEHTRSWGAYAQAPGGMGSLWNATARAFGEALSGQKTPEVAAAELHAEYSRMLGG